MSLVKGETRGPGKLGSLAKLYKSLDQRFKESLKADQSASCLFNLLELADDTDKLGQILDPLYSYYKSKEHIFNIQEVKLGVTLEDVLCLTGLLITGNPVICKNFPDSDAFRRVFGWEAQGSVTMGIMTSFVKDETKGVRERKNALLTIIVSSFITPRCAGHVSSTYVQLLENLSVVNDYAWGAALLSFLYRGIDDYYNVERKINSINGNLWIILGFIVIRIPKLRDLFGLQLDLDSYDGPILGCIAQGFKSLSKNHKSDYTKMVEKVKEVFEKLSPQDIC